jgi:hypothetical protein
MNKLLLNAQIPYAVDFKEAMTSSYPLNARGGARFGGKEKPLTLNWVVQIYFGKHNRGNYFPLRTLYCKC